MKTTVLRAKAQAVAADATRARQIEPEGIPALRRKVALAKYAQMNRARCQSATQQLGERKSYCTCSARHSPPGCSLLGTKESCMMSHPTRSTWRCIGSSTSQVISQLRTGNVANAGGMSLHSNT